MDILVINQPKSMDDFNRFNVRNSVGFIVSSSFCISTILYSKYNAESFTEYTESFHDFVTNDAAFGFTLILIYKMEEIFKFIKNVEEFIRERKFLNFSDVDNDYSDQ